MTLPIPIDMVGDEFGMDYCFPTDRYAYAQALSPLMSLTSERLATGLAKSLAACKQSLGPAATAMARLKASAQLSTLPPIKKQYCVGQLMESQVVYLRIPASYCSVRWPSAHTEACVSGYYCFEFRKLSRHRFSDL